MSFCYLLSAGLLFAAVLAFIAAGFAGTFARRLYGCRYRMMLSPLGFVVLGSIAHSVTARLLIWYSHAHPSFQVTHPTGFGSGAEVFETAVMLAAGMAGALCGVMLGSSLDREPSSDSTYTIANYWSRRPSQPEQPATAAPRKENLISFSRGRRQASSAARIAAITGTVVSKNE